MCMNRYVDGLSSMIGLDKLKAPNVLLLAKCQAQVVYWAGMNFIVGVLLRISGSLQSGIRIHIYMISRYILPYS
jgi:hypothetical protein